jgi:hypothetical protein
LFDIHCVVRDSSIGILWGSDKMTASNLSCESLSAL